MPRQPEQFATDYVMPASLVAGSPDSTNYMDVVRQQAVERIGRLIGEYVVAHPGPLLVSRITESQRPVDLLDQTVRVVWSGRVLPLADATNRQIAEFMDRVPARASHADGTYGFVGGPLDGRSIYTGGRPIWRQPEVTSPTTAADWINEGPPVNVQIAYIEYERGDDNVYRPINAVPLV